MKEIIFRILGSLVAAAVIFLATLHIRGEYKRMALLPAEKDILLKKTSPIPWLYILAVCLPVLYLAYLVGPWPGINVLYILSALLGVLVFFGYHALRICKNRLNNKYYELCKRRGVTFIPAGLNSRLAIRDMVWKDGEHRGVLFIGVHGTPFDAYRESNTSDKKPKSLKKGMVIVILVFGAIYLIWLAVQLIVFGGILEYR